MRLIPLLLALLIATPLHATPAADAVLAAAAADCASVDNGQFTAPGAVTHPDLNTDGRADEMINSAQFRCSTLSSMDAGTGGYNFTAIVDGTPTAWQALGWQLVPVDGGTVLLLAQHGGMCGGYGSQPCYQALIWSDGAFLTQAPAQ